MLWIQKELENKIKFSVHFYKKICETFAIAKLDKTKLAL